MFRTRHMLPLVLMLIAGTACERRNAVYATQVVATANDARVLQRSLEEYARGHGGRYPATLESLAQSIPPGEQQTEVRRVLGTYSGIVYAASGTASGSTSGPAAAYVLRVPTGVDGQDWVHATPGGDVFASSKIDASER